MILVDRLVWFHDGRYWCHMVSDTDLEELHRFAAALGISRSGFQDNPNRNHPHYDVPEQMYARALALGAVVVGGKELVRRMYRYPDRPSPHDRHG